MSDNKTNDNTSKYSCNNDVCYLATPEMEEAVVKVSVVNTKDNDPADVNVPINSTNTNPNGPEGPTMDFNNLLASTLQGLHQAFTQVDPNHDPEDDLTDTDTDESDPETEVADDWEEEDVEDSPVCAHLNDQRWKAFNRLLQSHNTMCRAFEKLLNEPVDTDGEDTDGEDASEDTDGEDASEE